jgi:hypothetical protein
MYSRDAFVGQSDEYVAGYIKLKIERLAKEYK